MDPPKMGVPPPSEDAGDDPPEQNGTPAADLSPDGGGSEADQQADRTIQPDRNIQRHRKLQRRRRRRRQFIVVVRAVVSFSTDVIKLVSAVYVLGVLMGFW